MHRECIKEKKYTIILEYIGIQSKPYSKDLQLSPVRFPRGQVGQILYEDQRAAMSNKLMELNQREPTSPESTYHFFDDGLWVSGLKLLFYFIFH